MNIKEVIFTSYCFGTAYLDQQVRLRESILAIYPDANIHFENELEEIGKPKFQQSLYGFKVQLVRDCLRLGFKKIIFFDTAITLQKKVDYWFDIIKERGVLAPIDRQLLSNVTSNNCLNYLGLTRDEVSEWNLVGGSVYVFDFDLPKCVEIFAKWENMEANGMFGTQDDLSHDRLQSHRMDETCMALAMKLSGVVPIGHDIMRYCYKHSGSGEITGSSDAIVEKRHFK